jgi:hypothetical protein
VALEISMMAKQGLGLGVVLGLLVASAQSGCGRSANDSGKPAEDLPMAGQGGGGEDPEVMGMAGAPPASGAGGESVVDAGSGAGGTGGVSEPSMGGEASVVGGAGPEACEPGMRSCDGSNVRVCGASGHSIIEETCSLSQVCSGAKCLPIACVPGHQFCLAGAIRECNLDGTSSTVFKACASGQFCREQDGGAECSPTACTGDAPVCVGNVATTCKPDGSGTKLGGVDCSATARLCSEGQCVDPTCTPGQKFCEHDDVYLCLGGGATSVLFTECNADEVCDPAFAACRDRICEPGKLGCDSTRTAVCNALGTGWEQSGADCAASDKVCVDGACKPHVCVANSQFCQDGDAYLCDAMGVSATLREACYDSYHCVTYAGSYAYCSYNSCVPGAAACNGNAVSTCNAEGSGVLAGGTDCGADKVCSGGACQTKVCEGNSTFCKDGDIAYCQGGLSSSTWTNCPDDAPCATTASGLACVPYKCWPGLKACLGNQLGTCAPDGNSLTVVKQDCAAADQICVSTSSCGTSVVDTLGEADELAGVSEGYFFGDVIDVQSSRALTSLEANVVLAAARDLRWCVFELVGYYYETRYEKVVKGQSGSGYLSSGALSYTLKAGKKYLLGVAVSGGGAAPYYDSVPWQPEVSFGKAVGGYSTAYATSMYGYYAFTNYLYDLRITTATP